MAYHTVTIADTGESYRCAEHRSVLEGMEALGKKGIPVGCRQGGCGVCKVQVLEGQYTKRVMSRAHVSAEEEAGGCVLSCPLDGAVLRRVPAGVCRWVGRESQDARQGRQGAGACAGSALRTP